MQLNLVKVHLNTLHSVYLCCIEFVDILLLTFLFIRQDGCDLYFSKIIRKFNPSQLQDNYPT